MVNSADRSASSHTPAYRSCMARAGVDVADRYDLVTRLRRGLPTREHVPGPATRGSEEWRAWRGRAESAMEADSRCRRAGHAAAWAVLGPRIRQFEVSHAEALQEEIAGWRRLEAKANRLVAGG
jgi:hypothetical protein